MPEMGNGRRPTHPPSGGFLTESSAYQRLREGDEREFRRLVGELHRSMIGVARGFVGSHATAEEVVQETWLAVLEGLENFEQRSSLKNWIFAILINKARTRARRESRVSTFSDWESLDGGDEPVAEPGRFDAKGYWATPPVPWDEVTPERIIAGQQLLTHVVQAIDALPPAQRSIVIMHDVEEMSPEDICGLLGISEANRRVLLHRARARIRRAVEALMRR